MEVTLTGVDPAHGQQTAMTGIAILTGGNQRLLAGVNLIRPLGLPLAALPPGGAVENMQSVLVGTEHAHDGNLVVPGSLVVPIVTIAKAGGFNMGGSFIRLTLNSGVLAIDPASPAPGTVPHIPMNTATATHVNNWPLSDPTLLTVALPAFRQALPLSLDRFDEGTPVIFTDQSGMDEFGIAVDITPTLGGGSTVTAFMLTQVINHPSVRALL
jgi:hypothetical protein